MTFNRGDSKNQPPSRLGQSSSTSTPPTSLTSLPEVDPNQIRATLLDPHHATPEQLLQLQQTHGNRVVQRLLNRAAEVGPPEPAQTTALQRLINVHQIPLFIADVNARFQGPANKNNRVAALRTHFVTATNAELTRIFGNVFHPQAQGQAVYTGGREDIKWQIITLLDTVGQQDYDKGGTFFETFRQEINAELAVLEDMQFQKQTGASKPHLASHHNFKVGNEFSFTNARLLELIGEMEKKGETVDEKDLKWYEAENQKAAEALVQEWDARLVTVATPRNLLSENSEDNTANQRAKTSNTAKIGIVREVTRDNKGLRINYKFPSLDWSYSATVDQGCIEIITGPAPASSIDKGEVGLAMDSYIFDIASQLELQAHATVGGGHINIDRGVFEPGKNNQEGVFEAGQHNLITFIENVVKDAAFWKEHDKDKVNAPFPDEFPNNKVSQNLSLVLNSYKARIAAARSKQELSALHDALVDELTKKVFTQVLANEKDPRNFAHYQAVNIEHYKSSNETPEDQRRVEMRRVPAQKSRQHLLNQLDRLFALVTGDPLPTPNRFG